MDKTNRLSVVSQEKHPFLSLISLILFIAGGYILASLLSVSLIAVIWNLSPEQITSMMTNPSRYKQAQAVMMTLQAFASFGGFILAPLLYLKFIAQGRFADLNPSSIADATPFLAVFFLVVGFIPVNNVVIEWNNAMSLPDALAPLEQWMKEKEESLAELTRLLTSFSSFFQFLIAVLVVAVIPAIGEELVFRGLLQNTLQRLTRNSHVAIWLAAFIFSAIHTQFYGLIPRMLLGAMFGYLYVWSGNLWLPIFAHFVNNGFTLLMVYLYKQQLSGIDIDDTRSVPLSLVFISFTLVVGILLYLKRHFDSVRPDRQDG